MEEQKETIKEEIIKLRNRINQHLDELLLLADEKEEREMEFLIDELFADISDDVRRRFLYRENDNNG